MKDETRQALNAINRRFYATRAGIFARKRTRPWAGFAPIIAELSPGDAILDVGAGHGRFAEALVRTGPPSLRYVGVDASTAMLARARTRSLPDWVQLRTADVVEQPLAVAVPESDFALVALFGLLHHIPGKVAREALLQAGMTRLRPGGLLAVSLWRFDRSPRFGNKRVDPALALRGHPSLGPEDLEEGDHFLSFDGRPHPPRYCHFPTEAELADLTSLPGTRLVSRFVPATGDRFNEYLLLRRQGDPR